MNFQKTTYSITLENLLHAQSETDGETGGSNDSEPCPGTTTGESGCGPGSLWCRDDQACVYKIKGKANAEVKFLGITIKLNAKGEAEYVYDGGKTHCIAGGNEQCRARYCPPGPVMGSN